MSYKKSPWDKCTEPTSEAIEKRIKDNIKTLLDNSHKPRKPLPPILMSYSVWQQWQDAKKKFPFISDTFWENMMMPVYPGDDFILETWKKRYE